MVTLKKTFLCVLIALFSLSLMVVEQSEAGKKSYKDMRHPVLNYTAVIKLSWFNDQDQEYDQKGKPIIPKVYVYLNKDKQVEFWCDEKVRVMIAFDVQPYSQKEDEGRSYWFYEETEVEKKFISWYGVKNKKMPTAWWNENRVYLTTVKKYDKYLSGNSKRRTEERSRLFSYGKSKILINATPVVSKVILGNMKILMKNKKR